MTVVIDESLVVAALVDGGSDGSWAESELGRTPLAAPHLLPVEVANILQRAVRSGAISKDVGAIAHDDLLALPIELFPYEPVAPRVWQLRDTVTAYDGFTLRLPSSSMLH